MTRPWQAVLAAALIAGCGGTQSSDTTPSGGGGGERVEDARGDILPPEAMDEGKRNLERKRPIVSRCLALAVDAKELPKNAAGKMTLEIVISPSGKADSVKVIRASLESKLLSEWVLGKIKEIQIPEPPKPYETSYTYRFEAM